MLLFFNIMGVITALILPTLACYPLVKIIYSNGNCNRYQELIFSFLLGSIVLTLLSFLGNLLGIPLNILSGICFLLVLWVSGMVCKYYYLIPINNILSDIDHESSEVNRGIKVCNTVITVLVILWFLAIAILVFTKDIHTMPALGIWGFKAKVIYTENEIPFSLFKDQSELFSHHSYPLAYPILLAWCRFFMLSYDDLAIKTVPFLFSILIYLFFYTVCKEHKYHSILTKILPLGICTGTAFINCNVYLYAELYLLLFVLTGSYLLTKYLMIYRKSYLFLSFLLLAGGAWVKNEGLLYFGFAATFIFLVKLWELLKSKDFSFRSLNQSFGHFLLAVGIPFGVFIFPWQMFRYFLDIPVRDFSFYRIYEASYSEHLGVLLMSLKKVLSNIFREPQTNCGIWYILILLLILQFKKRLRVEILFLLWMILTSIAIFTVSFIFSTRPLEWHMDSIPRIFLIPSCLAWLVIIFVCGAKGEEFKRK